MKHQEGYFNDDHGHSIYYQYWLPDTPPKGIVLMCHGLNEHSGRYHNFAEYFTQQGIGTYSLDHVGHGKTDGTRSYVKDFPTFINPLLTYLDMIEEWQPDVPVFLAGHSMGGLISTIFLIDHQERVSGVFLSGTLALIPDFVSNLTLKLANLLSALVPKMGLLAIDSEGLSRDKTVIQTYKEDPLVYNGKVTVRISDVMNQGIARIASEGSKINLPILLLHGSEDRLADPECSKYLHNLVSSQDNQLIIYDGLFHEIYNEPERKTVYKDVLKWLEEQIG